MPVILLQGCRRARTGTRGQSQGVSVQDVLHGRYWRIGRTRVRVIGCENVNVEVFFEVFPSIKFAFVFLIELAESAAGCDVLCRASSAGSSSQEGPEPILTHNVKLVLPLVILYILFQLFEARRKGRPVVRYSGMPQCNVATGRCRRYDGSCRVPLARQREPEGVLP